MGLPQRWLKPQRREPFSTSSRTPPLIMAAAEKHRPVTFPTGKSHGDSSQLAASCWMWLSLGNTSSCAGLLPSWVFLGSWGFGSLLAEETGSEWYPSPGSRSAKVWACRGEETEDTRWKTERNRRKPKRSERPTEAAIGKEKKLKVIFPNLHFYKIKVAKNLSR